MQPSRRRWLKALACLPLVGGVGAVAASTYSPAALPKAATALAWQRWGSGELRRFGFRVYRATLWAAGEDPLRPPFALHLQYALDIAGEKLASVSVDEMRRLGRGDEALLALWGERMKLLFPNVKAGESITGIRLPEGARFYHQEKLIGTVDDAAFADAFFAIWLDAKSSAPDVRAALLRRPEA